MGFSMLRPSLLPEGQKGLPGLSCTRAVGRLLQGAPTPGEPSAAASFCAHTAPHSLTDGPPPPPAHAGATPAPPLGRGLGDPGATHTNEVAGSGGGTAPPESSLVVWDATRASRHPSPLGAELGPRTPCAPQQARWGDLRVSGAFGVHSHVPPTWCWGLRHTAGPLGTAPSPRPQGPASTLQAQGTVTQRPPAESSELALA